MASMICGNCLTIDAPKRVKAPLKSSAGAATMIFGVLGLFIWPLLLLAGLCFAVGVAQALTHAVGGSVTLHCRTCKATALIPVETPRGQELVAHVHHRHTAAAQPLGPAPQHGGATRTVMCNSCNSWVAADLPHCPACGQRAAA